MSNRLLYEEGAEQANINIATQDIWMNGTLVIALLFILAAASIAEQASASVDPALALPPGTVTIQSYWDNSLDSDVDLWVKGPTGDPVGYSNKGGPIYNLLRDDLGNHTPGDPVNTEMTSSRGLPIGTSCVNLHLYRQGGNDPLPIAVKVTVTITKGDGNGKTTTSAPNLMSDVKLSQPGQELNVFCFVLDQSGDIVPGDKGVYSSQAIKLRSPGK